MVPKIYTKTGDRGETGILGRERLSKGDLRLDAYGTVDELNAVLGMVITILPAQMAKLCDILAQAQNHLFVIGSHLACADDKLRVSLPILDPSPTEQLEHQIDEMTRQLAELREFILPGGSTMAATLHFCRTVCRRAEREVVRFFDQMEDSIAAAERDIIISYLNRLGDYLFVAARFANYTFNVKENTWQK